MTSPNGNIFRVTGHLCGEFTGPGEFPSQRPVTRSFDVFFDLRLNKRLSKQSWGWWFETPSLSLWRHRNGLLTMQRGNTVTSVFNVLCNLRNQRFHTWIYKSYCLAKMVWFHSLIFRHQSWIHFVMNARRTPTWTRGWTICTTDTNLLFWEHIGYIKQTLV